MQVVTEIKGMVGVGQNRGCHSRNRGCQSMKRGGGPRNREYVWWQEYGM